MWVDSINVEVLLGGVFATDSMQAVDEEVGCAIESDLKKRRLCARCPCQVPQWLAGGVMPIARWYALTSHLSASTCIILNG